MLPGRAIQNHKKTPKRINNDGDATGLHVDG